jgi:hypothetical protein
LGSFKCDLPNQISNCCNLEAIVSLKLLLLKDMYLYYRDLIYLTNIVSHIPPLSVAPVGYVTTISEPTGTDELSCNCKHNSVYRFFFKEVTVALLVEKYHCLLLVEHKGHYSFHKCLSLDTLLSQINSLGVILSLVSVKRQVFEIKIRNGVSGIGWVSVPPVSSPFIAFVCGQQ